MGHLNIIKLEGNRYVIRNRMADSYLKFYQVNSDGSELPIWCHSITVAQKFDESEIQEISAKLTNLGYKIHQEDI